MSPKQPHAAESGVGKHTTRESERVQACAAGKERVTNAHPHKLAPEASKTSGAFFVFGFPAARTEPINLARALGRRVIVRTPERCAQLAIATKPHAPHLEPDAGSSPGVE